MRLYNVPFIFFQISYGLLNVSIDNFQMRYSLTFENSCFTVEDRFRFILGTSVTQCVKECSVRPHCLALNYRSRIKVCELFSTSKRNQLSPGHCLHLEKDDIDMIQSPCQNGCKYGEVCETIGSERGRCVIKECLNTTVPEYGAVLGNQREVGKTILYTCDESNTENNATTATIAECLDTGVWSANAECVTTDYIWAAWMDWSSCSLSCGSGVQTRSRTCSIPSTDAGGTQCQQNATSDETQTCNEQDCPVNFTWAAWMDWSPCSLSCDSGIQTRSRTCSIPTTDAGGIQCQQNTTGDETQTCNEHDCPAPTIGQACVNNADCIETEGRCIEGICFCHPLYRYNTTIKNCSKVCESMSDEFEEITNHIIKGFNDLADIATESSSRDACENSCISNLDCLAFELWNKGDTFGCTRSSVSREMILDADPDKFRYRWSITLYTRICN